MAPSGPMAAPFGPPPVLTRISLDPSGFTRVWVWRLISVRITEPSFMAMGPSGNWKSSAISCRSTARLLPGLSLAGTMGEGGGEGKGAPP